MAKIKKKRVGFVLDMTPLVDITFLLLTFFMFTAKFKTETESEMKYEVKRPKSTVDTTALPERNLMVIRVGIDSVSNDTAYVFSMTNEQDVLALRRMLLEAEYPDVDINSTVFVVRDLQWLGRMVMMARRINVNARVAIDADQRIRFEYVDKLIDVLRENTATTFNFVTDKKVTENGGQ